MKLGYKKNAFSKLVTGFSLENDKNLSKKTIHKIPSFLKIPTF